MDLFVIVTKSQLDKQALGVFSTYEKAQKFETDNGHIHDIEKVSLVIEGETPSWIFAANEYDRGTDFHVYSGIYIDEQLARKRAGHLGQVTKFPIDNPAGKQFFMNH